MALVVLASTLAAASAALSPIHVRDGHFVDQSGRVRLFHGINSVIKRFPWYDERMRDPARHKQIAEWGFTAVRLGAMWSGLEPEEGVFNETYVSVLQEIVAGLAEHGVHTYLDMHQDVLTGAAGYWGIPAWLAAKLRPADHPYPWPMADTAGFTTWACGYFTQEISNQFGQLYTEHRREFAAVWRGVAKRFAGNPSILGYELLNEPWGGDIYSDASLLLPGNAGYSMLQPFYEAASEAIREVDDETIIFWEPVTYAYFVNTEPNLILDSVIDMFMKSHNMLEFLPILQQVCGDMAVAAPAVPWQDLAQEVMASLGEAQGHRFNSVTGEAERPSVLGPGFTAPPGGKDYLNRTAMSWHYYCWALGYGHDSDPYDPVLRTVCDDLLGTMVFNTVDARAQELGGSATMLTEFGICGGNYDEPASQGNIECNYVLGQADSHFQSWSYWDTASGGYLWDSQGDPVIQHVKVLARPYPQATAGTPVSLQFDPQTRVMHYQYTPSASPHPTVVYVPPLLYTSGYSLESSSNLEVGEGAAPHLLTFTATDTEPAHIVIRPKD